jgi:hypothetical protein
MANRTTFGTVQALILATGVSASLMTLVPAQEPGTTPAEGNEAGSNALPRVTVKDRAFLGLYTEKIGAENESKGIRVTRVMPFSAAKEMGFLVGDEIIACSDVLVNSPAQFANELRRVRTNARLKFLVRRDGKNIKIDGKIGSYVDTMVAYEKDTRGRLAGKPFPAPPQTLWLNRTTKKWQKDPDPFGKLKGTVAVVFAFDQCKFCVDQKLIKFAAMSNQYDQIDGTPISFMGIYYRQGNSNEESFEIVEDLLAQIPAQFPVGVAFYPPGARPDLDEQVLLHQHGTAILNKEGLVEYLQIFGPLDVKFANAYQEALAAKP